MNVDDAKRLEEIEKRSASLKRKRPRPARGRARRVGQSQVGESS